MNELNFWIIESYFLSLNVIKSYPLFLNLLCSSLGISGGSFNKGQDALLFKPLKPSEDQVLLLGLVVLLVVHVVSLLQVKAQDQGLGEDAVDESGDDEAGFRLPRLIPDQDKEDNLAAVIVQSSPPEGRELDDNLKPTGFSFPQDHSAPNKAGFRLPPAASSGRDSEDFEVFIVEGQVEDEEEEDAFIVVAAPSNPEEDNGDFVVIVGSEDPGASREPKILEPLRRPSQVDCGAPLDRGICQARSVQPESDAFYYDAREKKCVLFIYSGCGGNSNRFSSIDEC